MSQTNVVRDSAISEIAESCNFQIITPVKSKYYIGSKTGGIYLIMHPMRTQIIMKILLDNVNRLNWTRK